MKDRIVSMLLAGNSYANIVAEVGCAKATITYHAKRLGLSHGPIKRYDWVTVQAFHNAGHSFSECRQEFGFCKATWDKARDRGELRVNDHRIPMEVLLVEGSQHHRGGIKSRLLTAGLLRNECYACGIGPMWNGNRLVMVLDHINGVNDDYRIENLRLLCPNCDSQQPTFAGRNKRWRVGELVDPPGSGPGHLAGSMPAAPAI
jgi:hypothetical protein